MLAFLTIFLPFLVQCTPEYDYYYEYPSSDEPSPGIEMVQLHSTFNISCISEVSGSSLYHNNHKIDILPPKVTRAESENGFIIHNAQFSDSGRWGCQSKDIFEEKNIIVSNTGVLSVLVGGDLILNSTVIYLRRDSVVELTCSLLHVPGEPGDKLIWRETNPGLSKPLPYTVENPGADKDGFSYYLAKLSSEVLFSSNINEISCLSNNKELKLKIIMEFRPEFTISRNPGFGVPIMEEMTVSLKCTVESNPGSIPVWEHNGMPVQSHQSNLSNVAEINFDRISISDEGWFQCTAQHKFGNFSSVGYYLSVKPKSRVTESGSRTTSSALSDQVLLVESVPEKGQGCGDNKITDYTLPEVTPDRKTISQVSGDTVKMRIEFCSNPQADRVFWSGPNLLLEPGSNSSKFLANPLHESRTGCSLAELVGENLNPGDSGLYILIVRNSYHVVEGRIQLEIREGFNSSLAGAQFIYPNLFLLLIFSSAFLGS